MKRLSRAECNDAARIVPAVPVIHNGGAAHAHAAMTENADSAVRLKLSVGCSSRL